MHHSCRGNSEAACASAQSHGVLRPSLTPWCLLCGGSSVSTLQDVLVFASPRLLHPSTAIGASLASFSTTAQAVMGLTINSTAQLAQVLLMPESAAAGLAHR